MSFQLDQALIGAWERINRDKSLPEFEQIKYEFGYKLKQDMVKLIDPDEDNNQNRQ